MSSDFPRSPKFLKGAVVAYGINIPPLFIPFQFKPETLTKSKRVLIIGMCVWGQISTLDKLV